MKPRVSNTRRSPPTDEDLSVGTPALGTPGSLRLEQRIGEAVVNRSKSGNPRTGNDFQPNVPTPGGKVHEELCAFGDLSSGCPSDVCPGEGRHSPERFLQRLEGNP